MWFCRCSRSSRCCRSCRCPRCCWCSRCCGEFHWHRGQAIYQKPNQKQQPFQHYQKPPQRTNRGSKQPRKSSFPGHSERSSCSRCASDSVLVHSIHHSHIPVAFQKEYTNQLIYIDAGCISDLKRMIITFRWPVEARRFPHASEQMSDQLFCLTRPLWSPDAQWDSDVENYNKLA